MDRLFTTLAGMGLGAGLMYLFDPDMGRRRRALARDKAVSLAHEASDAASVVGRDLKNRAQGLASGDLSVLVGGKRALQNPFQGGWSPTGRALMGGLGAFLFTYGLTRRAPEACVLGTIGLGLMAEAATNAGVSDIKCLAEKAGHLAKDSVQGLFSTSGNAQARDAYEAAAIP